MEVQATAVIAELRKQLDDAHYQIAVLTARLSAERIPDDKAPEGNF